MIKKIKLNIPFFVILGAMNGAILSLVTAFFLDYFVTSYSTTCNLTYTDWLLVCAPLFALIGALFNTAAAIFMYESVPKEVKEPKKRQKKN